MAPIAICVVPGAAFLVALTFSARDRKISPSDCAESEAEATQSTGHCVAAISGDTARSGTGRTSPPRQVLIESGATESADFRPLV